MIRPAVRTRRRPPPPALRCLAAAALTAIGIAGCAVPPAPCAVANDALAVTDVRRDQAGFLVTVHNGATQPLTEKVFVEVALLQGGGVVLAGSTATTATWPAGGSRDLAVPYLLDSGLDNGAYETVTHFKCLSR